MGHRCNLTDELGVWYLSAATGTARPKVGSSERGSVGSRQAYILAYETACCQYASITAARLQTVRLCLLPTLGLGVQFAAIRYQAPGLSGDGLPSQHRQNFPADVARVRVRRQKDVGRRELLRLSGTPH